jgi:hypothetical protein
MISLLSRDQAELLLAPYLPLFRTCLQSGLQRWRDLSDVPEARRLALRPRSRASMIHDYATEQAQQTFAGMKPNVELLEVRGFTVVKVEDRILLRFRKFSRGWRTNLNPTTQQKLWDAQEPLPGLGAMTHLSAGYRLDDTGELDGMGVVCSREGQPIWVLPLDDQGGTSTLGELASLPEPPPASGPRVRSTLIDADQRDEGSGEH